MLYTFSKLFSLHPIPFCFLLYAYPNVQNIYLHHVKYSPYTNTGAHILTMGSMDRRNAIVLELTILRHTKSVN